MEDRRRTGDGAGPAADEVPARAGPGGPVPHVGVASGTAGPGFPEPEPDVVVERAPHRPVSCSDLGHPLHPAAPLVRRLLDALFADPATELSRPGAEGTRHRLERLRAALRASSAGLVAMGPSGTACWTDPPPAGTATALVGDLVSDLRSVTGDGWNGVPGRVARAVDGTTVLAVPLARTGADAGRLLVVVRPDPAMLVIGEPLSVVLGGFLTPRDDLRENALEIEIGVLTALRSRFGLLPDPLCERALDRYRSRLASLVMIFEPVVRLDPDPARVGIRGWEALARRAEGERSAPVGLLDVATVWGDRFVVERDGVLAATALRTYVASHAASTWRGRRPKPLAINVAVRSIMDDRYVEELRAAIAASGLPDGGVTLEISEKDRIAPPPGEVWLPSPMGYFRDRIGLLAADLQVNFAVDDFGVGQASLDRLASLTLTQIKIDRAILGHPLAREELGLVVQVAEHALRRGDAPRGRPIIMEGVAPDTAVPLSDIHAVGIRFVQGYLMGETASARLRPLGRDIRERVAALVGRPVTTGAAGDAPTLPRSSGNAPVGTARRRAARR